MSLRRSLALLALCPALATAQVSYTTSLAAWDPTTTSTLATDFESLGVGGIGSFSLGGIAFSSPGSTLYIVPIGSTDSWPLPTSKMLTGNGPDIIRMEFGAGVRGVGFNVNSNRYAPAGIQVFGAANLLLDSYTMTQPSNTYGFLGISALQDITAVLFTAVTGQIQDASIDNVRLMAAAPSEVVPEPASVVLVATGLIGVAGVARSRNRRQP